MRDAFQDTLLDVAAACTDPIDFKALTPRPCPWLALQPLTDTPLKEWSKERRQTMEMACNLAEELSDRTISILDKLDGASNFQAPKLKLESDQKTPEQLAAESGPDETVLQWMQPMHTLEERFNDLRRVREQRRRDQGLNPIEPFRPNELNIIANSLDIPVEHVLELENDYLQRKQREAQHVRREKLGRAGGMKFRT